jgi:hypothetical protein
MVLLWIYNWTGNLSLKFHLKLAVSTSDKICISFLFVGHFLFLHAFVTPFSTASLYLFPVHLSCKPS